MENPNPFLERTHPKTGLKRFGQGGYTLIELMIAIAIMAIITPALLYLFSKVTQGMAADEMHTALQKGNQTLLNRIHVRMGGSKHFFFGDSSGVSFVGVLNMTTAPTTVAGTTLPQLQAPTPTPGVVSFSVSPNWSLFQKGYVGNSILFAAYDTPETIFYANGTSKAVTDSPMTCTGAGMTQTDGTPRTVIIDLYRFYYYYLSSQNTKQLYDGTDYSVIEWQSIRFADFFEIADFGANGDSILEANIMAKLASQGITMGWDYSQTNPASAFISFGGAVNYGGSPSSASTVTSYTIPMEIANNVTRVPVGVLTSGFHYGISPNTNNWRNCPGPVQIPLFAPVTTAGVAFPNGFEVVTAGNSSGREVMIRCVWVAEGATMPHAVYNDMNMVDYVRDVW